MLSAVITEILFSSAGTDKLPLLTGKLRREIDGSNENFILLFKTSIKTDFRKCWKSSMILLYNTLPSYSIIV